MNFNRTHIVYVCQHNSVRRAFRLRSDPVQRARSTVQVRTLYEYTNVACSLYVMLMLLCCFNVCLIVSNVLKFKLRDVNTYVFGSV